MAVLLASGIDIAFSVIDLLRGAFMLSIPLFVAALLGSLLHKKISKKFKRSWFASAVIVCLVFSLAAVSLAYFYPLAYGFGAESLGEKPQELQPDASDWAALAVTSIFRVSTAGIFLAAVSLFFVMLGSFPKEWLEKKKFNKYICLYASVYACTFFASFLFLFAFGNVLQGMLYFLYS
jgi:predicted PurR-regulated permease PerM